MTVHQKSPGRGFFDEYSLDGENPVKRASGKCVTEYNTINIISFRITSGQT
jgi:hypothetical protein